MSSTSLAERVLETLDEVQVLLMPYLRQEETVRLKDACQITVLLELLRSDALKRQGYSEHERSRRSGAASASVTAPRSPSA